MRYVSERSEHTRKRGPRGCGCTRRVPVTLGTAGTGLCWDGWGDTLRFVTQARCETGETRFILSLSMFYQYPPRAEKQGKKLKQTFQYSVFCSPSLRWVIWQVGGPALTPPCPCGRQPCARQSTAGNGRCRCQRAVKCPVFYEELICIGTCYHFFFC